MSDQVRKRRTISVKTWILDAVIEAGEPELSPLVERLLTKFVQEHAGTKEQRRSERALLERRLGELEREYDARRATFKTED